jgi:hypothetical protein
MLNLPARDGKEKPQKKLAPFRAVLLCVLCGSPRKKSWRRFVPVFGLRDEAITSPLVLKATSRDRPNHPDETETGM